MIFRRSVLTISNQGGVVLVASLMILASLAVLSLWGISSNLVDNRVTTNYRDHIQAYYAAEAGLERAREYLRGLNYNTELQNASGADSQLVNSTNINNFPGDDVPIYSNQTIGNNSYTVYITNDAGDGVTNTNDTNGRITITAFGFGSGNTTSVVQAILANDSLSFAPPSPLVLPGPSADVRFGRSNQWLISGDDSAGDGSKTAITVSTETAKRRVESAAGRRSDQITSGGESPSVEADPGAISQAGLDDIQNLHDTLDDLRRRADYTDRRDPGFNLGTEQNPEIVFIDGSFSTRHYNSGYGILVVTNTLTIRGNFNYNGLILVVGRGNLIMSGGGNSTIQGSIIVADIDGRDNRPLTADDSWESPLFMVSGGGTSQIIYNSEAANNPLKNDAPRIISIAQKYGQ